MKLHRRILALLTVLLLLSGCAGEEGTQTGLELYYARESNLSLDSALSSVAWEGETGIESIFQQLLLDQEDEGLVSLIPSRTTLKGWSVEDGVLYLNLSGEFGTLSGIELTMASYCLVLTYCQLEEVSAVAITADGEYLLEQELLTPQQVILDGGEGDTGTMTATLYFPLSDGSGIGSEQRVLTITENRSKAESILDALCAGAEDKELSVYLPESDQGITLWIQESICYVNLTEEWRLELEEDWSALPQKLQCVVNSLCQLDDVESVQFLMDGAVLEGWSEINGDFPMTAEP